MNRLLEKITPIQLLRRLTQIVSFILLPGLFTSTFYAIKEIYIALTEGSFHFSELSSQVLLLVAIIPITIIMGRFFCGFFCSFGSMGDLIWFISRKTRKPQFKIGEKEEALLKLLKYLILVFIIIGIWSLNLITFNSMSSPWNIFGMYASIGGWPSFKYLISFGGLLLLLIIAGSFYVERFFCRYLCPLGAIFAVISKLRLFNIDKKTEKCGSCRICTNKCTMAIPLYKYDKVTSGECINCFACIESCPRKNVKANPTPAVASAVSVAAISSMVYVGNIASASASEMDYTSSITTTVNTAAGNYTDGIYTGSAFGFRGDTEVSVTVENGNITDITILSYEDDREYFVRAADSVISDIIESQDVNVDAVSGATFSSNGIMNAVADALNVAGSTVNNDTSSDYADNNLTDNEESYGNGLDSANGSNNANGLDGSNGSDSANSADASDSETAGSTKSLQDLQDGTYTGTGTGFRGETEVSVTVADGKISDITITSYMDDEQFFVRAQDSIISEIIENQNVNVDAVSGATFSSNGIMEAVANAIGVSYTNTNDTATRGGHGGFGFNRH